MSELPNENSTLLRSHHTYNQVEMNLLKKCKGHLQKRKVLVDILAILFGVGAWIAVNGMFVQLPLLVQTQPEGWNLPSYLSVIVQIANIGPVLYSVTYNVLKNKIKDSSIIYAVLLMGTLSLLLMALLHKETTYIAGENHSTSLFILSFFISLVGCTSSVLFMPFMKNFREVYLISYFVGEGLSGFLPSIVSLIQGIGGNPVCVNVTYYNSSSHENYTTLQPYTPPPKFSTESFFYFLFGTMAISTFSFYLLNNLQSCKSEKVKGEAHSEPFPTTVISVLDNEGEVVYKDRGAVTEGTHITDGTVGMESSISRRTFFYLLIIGAWICMFGNGVFPSIQSYSCLPYGNVAYHLSATLGSMANPVACFLAFFLPYSSISAISSLTVLSTVVACYIAATAVMSPAPPLVGQTAGEVIVVLSWIIFTGLISYTKVSIASLLRQRPGRSLFWCGAVQQMGSAVGAIMTFFLVNSANIFHPYYPCQ